MTEKQMEFFRIEENQLKLRYTSKETKHSRTTRKYFFKNCLNAFSLSFKKMLCPYIKKHKQLGVALLCKPKLLLGSDSSQCISI